jgi:hypothetical protein
MRSPVLTISSTIARSRTEQTESTRRRRSSATGSITLCGTRGRRRPRSAAASAKCSAASQLLKHPERPDVTRDADRGEGRAELDEPRPQPNSVKSQIEKREAMQPALERTRSVPFLTPRPQWQHHRLGVVGRSRARVQCEDVPSSPGHRAFDGSGNDVRGKVSRDATTFVHVCWAFRKTRTCVRFVECDVKPDR